MSVGSRIKELRENKGLSRNDLAELLNITVGAISNYENEVSSPKEPILFKIMDVLNCDANYLFQDAVKMQSMKNSVSVDEMKYIEKYRFIAEHSPTGIKTIDYILNHEYEEAKELKERLDELVQQANRIAELESRSKNIIEYQPHCNKKERMANYYHSVSAGSGVFIMGNEVVDQIPIPDTPENRNVDYAIRVSGNSMEPDFYDGDIVLVSQKEEIRYGDVGIFIINGDAYIKEYGETKLISRNSDVNNIEISEYDNIVCMGKVLGKVDN